MSTIDPATDFDAFRKIDTWIFDLDNTLYPRSCNLFAQMDVRMTAFIQNLKGLSFDAARKLQKDHYRDYGTTLRGLMEIEKIDPADYLSYVHDIDYSTIEEAPALRTALKALPGRKLIFTNGDTPHARRTTDRLGITDIFDHVFDIVQADLVPKPGRAPYEKFVETHGVNPTTAAMFEDMPRNLAIPHEMGMRTVLITDEPEASHSRQDWETKVTHHNHIHHRTDDITQFLEAVNSAFGSIERL